jgi:hypothetical protein
MPHQQQAWVQGSRGQLEWVWAVLLQAVVALLLQVVL